jgi:hypothetical protein
VKPAELVNAIHAIAREIADYYITDPLAPVLIEAYGADGGEIIMPVKTAEFMGQRVERPAAYAEPGITQGSVDA